MTACDAGTSESATSVAAYEELRSRVLAGSASGSGIGLVVLLREGLAAWTARCAVFAGPVAPAVDPDRRAAAPALSDEVHSEVVRVLASMALAGRGHAEMTA